MKRELVAWDLLLPDGVLDEPFGQHGRLPMGDHPPHHIAAVDVQDRVELVVGAFDGSFETGDVPGPHLVRPGGEQLRPGVMQGPRLVAPLSHLAVPIQYAVHGARRTQVVSFVQHSGPDLVRRPIDEALLVQEIEDGLLFALRERSV